MYEQIELQLDRIGMTKKDMAQKLGIPYDILLLKLSGKQDFTFDEAVQIHDLIQAKKSV